MGNAIGKAPAFTHRGKCTDLDDLTLADGYYTFDKNASGFPDSWHGVGDCGILTVKTEAHATGAFSVKTYRAEIYNPPDGYARDYIRVHKKASGFWNYNSGWQSEGTPWVVPNFGSNWSGGTGWYDIKYRRVQRRVDVEINAYASGGTPAASIFTLASGYRPEYDVVIPAMVLDAGFYVLRPMTVKNYQDGGGVNIAAVAGEYVYASFSFLVL